MAGIDWFRWHHGSVTDPKFGLVARKAGARLGDVLAVWAFVLETASASEQRGVAGDVDAESLDYLLGLDDGAAQRILDAMTQRGLLADGGTVVSWEKRQPKRERENDNSSERVKAFREKQRQETPSEDSETPCNATKRQETPREEKSRQEKKEPKTHTAPVGAGVPDLFDEAWAAYPKREGGNSKSGAQKAWNARIRIGMKAEDMLAGVKRYAAFCQAKGMVGTQYVMQAQTFFGPEGKWTEDWVVAHPQGAGPIVAHPRSGNGGMQIAGLRGVI